MQLTALTFRTEAYPTAEHYPFSLPVFRRTPGIEFRSPVTFFIGENGTGKSTLLEAIARRCGIHIWGEKERSRVVNNPHAGDLHRCLDLAGVDGAVTGSFFASELFRSFAQNLDEWAALDPGVLHYFGDASLLVQSHGQYHMAFFRNRFNLPGLYLLDEPENALSPRRQLELLRVIRDASRSGTAQFIIATHSPILLACPGADILCFDQVPLARVAYEETGHYRTYKEFLENRDKYL